MKYIALLDSRHLENNLFMKAFADAVSRQDKVRGIIVHGDSPYTDRLIQTGMMREDARIRSTKELNIRIVSVLADSGVSAIGLNPFQRDSIVYNPVKDELAVNTAFFDSLPESTFLVLSNLVGNTDSKQPAAYPLVSLTLKLQSSLKCDEIFAFSSEEKDEVLISKTPTASIKWENLEDNYKNIFIPPEVVENPLSFCLTTTRAFSQVPDLSDSKKIIYKGSQT